MKMPKSVRTQSPRRIPIGDRPHKIHEEPTVSVGDLVTWSENYARDPTLPVEMGVVFDSFWSLLDWFIADDASYNEFYTPAALVKWQHGAETHTSHSALMRIEGVRREP